MDIEKERRAELIEILGKNFRCYEEVRLRHALFGRRVLRADVIAVPVEGEFSGVPIAFEVKQPAYNQQFKFWIYALRQAADYVYGRIEPQLRTADSLPIGRRVAAAFIFPAPHISDFGLDGGTDPLLGAATLALHYRVGQVRPSRRNEKIFSLAFANNEIWQADRGFNRTAVQFLDGRFPLGAGAVNAIDELDLPDRRRDVL